MTPKLPTPQGVSAASPPLQAGSPCPDGYTVGYPGRKEPERLRVNVDGELSCPTCPSLEPDDQEPAPAAPGEKE